MGLYETLDALFSRFMGVNLAFGIRLMLDILLIPLVIWLAYLILVDLTTPFGNFDRKQRAMKDLLWLVCIMAIGGTLYYINAVWLK